MVIYKAMIFDGKLITTRSGRYQSLNSRLKNLLIGNVIRSHYERKLVNWNQSFDEVFITLRRAEWVESNPCGEIPIAPLNTIRVTKRKIQDNRTTVLY